MTSRRFVPPPVPVTLAVAAVFHAAFWPIALNPGSEDVRWLRHIVEAGPLHATLSGLTIVKGVSLLGNVALIVATARLLRRLGTAHAGRWASLVALLPTTILNTALLGQCDALYAAPCIAAIEAAVARRHTRMLLWCGVAIAFKTDAVLFAPFVVALLIHRRVGVARWLVVPALFVASLLPAWALGWPMADLAISYRQAGATPLLSLDAPNVWFVVQTLMPAHAAALTGLAMAAAVGATGAYIACFSARMPLRGLLPVAILAVLVTAGLLPHMHERAFFVADVAAFAWAASTGERHAWIVAALVQAGSTLAVIACAYGAPAPAVLGFACMATATSRLAAPLLRPAANDNLVLARAT